MSLAPPTRKPTLAAIARLTGVSAPTVSKVVNGRGDVAEGTRAKVLAALEEAGYESPAHRRNSDGPQTVEVAFDSVTSNYSSALLDGILEGAAEAGAEIVVGISGSSRGPGADLDRKARRMVDEGRAGLIVVTSAFTPSHLAAFRRRRLPVVVVDPLNPPPAGVVSVGATNWSGGRAAAEHLLDLGHERIAYLGGPESAECNQARLHGYLSALMSRGISVEAGYVIHGRFRAESGISGLTALLALEKAPTAIFAGSDAIAVGVLREARHRGIRVPEDLSLVGFDGTALAEDSVPALTSVAQPLQDMGRIALRTLLRQSRGEQLDSHRVELATQLVVRESTAPLS
ncbi:LacI family transcriptional regulator [Sinomonas atrocyanea]|uniref:LacI family transcriptional regulator n=1 Tax=Sinomonas atrocyanea TaxID=37927 RepID=A0A126ZVH0_9MICC|nr:LacI family DNA-binding transcriptional regulator [Sinomonas atrocyanea]AMM31158.1 LacI family transcriptional regulator [Sinomonas atrocyanea]GEB64180.1 transcriptional regulator [Sinomonas atrocyanea]GGG73873.1 transcriptional regulator [Sinomonas atrocyanea]